MTLPLALTIALLFQPAVQLLAVPSGAAAVKRFQQIDQKLYRGAQPDAEGFRQLRDLGVKIVINLRSEQDAIKTGEQRIVESLGMRYVSLPVRDGNFFTRSRIIPDDTIRKFFAALDAADGPVFVHCHRGADRTGALAALYRIARHGWDNERAYAEARTLGMRSWYAGLKRQILAFKPGAELLAGGARP
jgi:uncharacterized protein (TIGR01244 family)